MEVPISLLLAPTSLDGISTGVAPLLRPGTICTLPDDELGGSNFIRLVGRPSAVLPPSLFVLSLPSSLPFFSVFSAAAIFRSAADLAVARALLALCCDPNAPAQHLQPRPSVQTIGA
jgi:hypothetical protein